MSENDAAQLDLKKRARRRLVGAVALAVFAAVVLPMVMDQEPQPVMQDIQIRIPSQDADAFTSRILPAKPEAAPMPPAEIEPSEPLKPAEPPASQAEPAGAAETPQGPARAEAASAAPEAGQWILQIGAYRDAANVANLQAKLKERGYNFYTEPLVSDGVKKTRVRAGPFTSRDAAEKARDRLKRIGIDGVVAQKQ